MQYTPANKHTYIHTYLERVAYTYFPILHFMLKEKKRTNNKVVKIITLKVEMVSEKT